VSGLVKKGWSAVGRRGQRWVKSDWRGIFHVFISRKIPGSWELSSSPRTPESKPLQCNWKRKWVGWRQKRTKDSKSRGKVQPGPVPYTDHYLQMAKGKKEMIKKLSYARKRTCLGRMLKNTRRERRNDA